MNVELDIDEIKTIIAGMDQTAASFSLAAATEGLHEGIRRSVDIEKRKALDVSQKLTALIRLSALNSRGELDET